MKVELGELKQVSPREKWAGESSDFTPWLAHNLSNLADQLGLELELESTEASVGPYSADILAKDTGTSQYVVIENQLAKTDHDHLGKALTYASVLDASAVVWVATEFTDEHRKALDWLNDNTVSGISFFGVIVELWQIDDSRPAVKFNVVSKPAEIVKQTAVSRSAQDLTEARKLQLDFWMKFREKLLETRRIPSVQSARPQYWFDVSLGRSGINLSNFLNTYEKKIGVRVYISNTVANSALPQLLDMREEIENELGEKLEWDPNPEARDKVIRLVRDADIDDRTKWDECLDWMVNMTVKFRQVFAKRIKDMDLSAPADQIGTNEDS